MYSKDELKNLKLEFWESFAAFCEVQPYLRGRKKIWTLYDTKGKGLNSNSMQQERGRLSSSK